MSNKINVAVVGATGAVGETMLAIMAERDFPAANVVALASERSAGKRVTYGTKQLVVGDLEKFDFSDTQVALFSPGASVSAIYAPKAADAGCVVVDNTSQFRYDDDIPLVIPEVNADAIGDYKNRNIIANPNCSTIQMLVVLKPIHDKYCIKRVIVNTYQAVSGSGQAAVEELRNQIRAFTNGEEILTSVYPHQIAFNVLPQIDVFLESGYSKEEMKMILETAKILDPKIKMTATTVRVPVMTGHSESLNIETEKPFEVEEIKTLMEESPGIVLQDDPGKNVYPLAINVAGKDAVFVGRIRRDFSAENTLNMWCASDNLRKGTALNTIQIVQEIIKRNLVRIQ